MGLGKTLQTIALIHAILANQELTKVKRILILQPKNVILNWESEFKKWTSDCKYKVEVSRLTNKGEIKEGMPKNCGSSAELKRWYNRGGVFLINYDKFIRLVTEKNSDTSEVKQFKEYLLNPGADLIVFDEGHILKSNETMLAKCLIELRTLRRIILTGNVIIHSFMLSFEF